jgi:hypothetical protein
MNTIPSSIPLKDMHPVRVEVERQIAGRNRLTTAFRIILAIPHAMLVGGPLAAGIPFGSWTSRDGADWGIGSSAGALGAVACVCAVIAWFAILFARKHPDGLWNLGAFYLRWRVRAVAYMMLLRDEYPPFGEAAYPAFVEIDRPTRDRDRLTVALRLIYALPHFVVLCFLGIGWMVTSILAWFSILLTGEYPESLYDFGVGVLRWSTRVEAYLLLLHDEYPPFRLQ